MHWCHHESEIVRQLLPFIGVFLAGSVFCWHRVAGFFKRVFKRGK